MMEKQEALRKSQFQCFDIIKEGQTDREQAALGQTPAITSDVQVKVYNQKNKCKTCLWI